MIQRIQSLYLLITAVLMALVVFLPLGRFLSADQEFILTAFGIKEAHGEYAANLPYLGILAGIAALLPFVTIFLYRNRFAQIRFCIVEIVLLIGSQLLLAYYVYHGSSAFDGPGGLTISYSVVDILPLVGIILTWLALRGVSKDEALVRSLNRIR